MPDRYHLTLTAAGRPAMHGWWADEAVARDKFTRWIGRNVADARITLVDDETGTMLAQWPGLVSGES